LPRHQLAKIYNPCLHNLIIIIITTVTIGDKMETLSQSKHETEWVTISLDEYESMKATIETLSNCEAVDKIRRGEKELQAGRGKDLEKLKKELGL
jgi:PHD/YefM family antitoxin component YafN of YafNO toxin-antitoxin module